MSINFNCVVVNENWFSARDNFSEYVVSSTFVFLTLICFRFESKGTYTREYLSNTSHSEHNLSTTMVLKIPNSYIGIRLVYFSCYNYWPLQISRLVESIEFEHWLCEHGTYSSLSCALVCRLNRLDVSPDL